MRAGRLRSGARSGSAVQPPGLMRAAGLWIPRPERPPRVHQPRNPRASLGELVQIDGSDHRWFEERAAACTLLVFIDDTTGRTDDAAFHADRIDLQLFRGTVEVSGRARQAGGVLQRQGQRLLREATLAEGG